MTYSHYLKRKAEIEAVAADRGYDAEPELRAVPDRDAYNYVFDGVTIMEMSGPLVHAMRHNPDLVNRFFDYHKEAFKFVLRGRTY